jgi:hypothetical protein
MKTRGFVLFTVFVLAFLLPSFTLVAQQPRAIPPNDNFITATVMTIGKSYSMPDLGAATNQAGEPITSCRSSSVIPNSVWYTFSVPEYSFVRLSTYGSFLATNDLESGDTVIAVYTLTGPATFTEVACNDDANGITSAQTVFPASAGITYYVAAGSYADYDFLPSSTLKLKTQMLWTSVKPVNNGFESPLGGPGWQVTNDNDDTRVCADLIYPAAIGSCAFRFIGTPDLTTKVVQTVPFPTGFVPRKSAEVWVGFYIRIMDTGILESTKVKITIAYKDGTAPTVRTINLSGTAAGSNTFRRAVMTLASGKVASVRFETKFGAEDGVLMLDEVSIDYNADSSTRSAGLLAVPPSPSAK